MALYDFPDAVIALYLQAEQDILADMARRLATYDYWIPSAEHQRQMLREMGVTQQQIIKRMSELTGKSAAEINQMIQQACEDALDTDKAWYQQHGIDAPTEMSAEMAATLDTGLKKTGRMFKNLTKTTAQAGASQYIDALDRAWLQITSGAFDYNTAIRNAVKDLAKQGIDCIHYPPSKRFPHGRRDTIEVAVRRATVTGVNQTAGEMKWQLADELGCDLVEVTAHAGARPEHAVWQGQIFSRSGKSEKYPEFKSSTGYGTGAGLMGWNCSHNFHPYVDGTPRTYTDEMLEQYNAKTIEYNGKMYTEYEATQIQRRNERQIRRWKRENVAMGAAGQDTAESAMKIKSWQDKQKEFLKQTGLKPQGAREQIAGFGKSEARKATAAARKKAVASGGRSGIIKTDRNFRDVDDMLIDITQESIDAVPLVEIPGWSASMNEDLQAAHKRLLKEAMSAETGTEFASVHRMDMSQVGEIIHDPDVDKSVHIPDQSFDYIALHNHPSGTVFSHPDISKFLGLKHIQMLTAVGNDGSVFVLKKKPQYQMWKASANFAQHGENIKFLMSDRDAYGYMQEMYSIIKESEKYGVEFIEART